MQPTYEPRVESKLLESAMLMPAYRAVALAVVLLLGLAMPPVGASAKEKKEKVTLAEFTRRLPARVQDRDSTPGDMLNFVLVGSRSRVEKALATAGWKQVDRTKAEAAVRAILSTMRKKPYTELPMSELFLFGRAQDYGYARAEPLKVVAARHHFRLWKSPWETSSGEEIWLGAGTHDIGFEENRRTGEITHKIDPEVDKERDFIAQTLQDAGQVAGLGYVLPAQPVRQATTAHGAPFHSDGRVLVIVLK